MFEAIFNALKDFMCWVIETFLGFASWLINFIVQTLESVGGMDFSTVSGPMSAVNYVVPVGFGAGLLLSYYTFKIWLIVVRYILKAIPTVW